jgi:hypothetical protein
VLVCGMVDDEVRVGEHLGHDADVARIRVDRVERGERNALVRAEELHAELQASLDEGDARVRVVQVVPGPVRAPWRVTLPRADSVHLVDVLHAVELLLLLVVREHHAVVHDALRAAGHHVDDLHRLRDLVVRQRIVGVGRRNTGEHGHRRVAVQEHLADVLVPLEAHLSRLATTRLRQDGEKHAVGSRSGAIGEMMRLDVEDEFLRRVERDGAVLARVERVAAGVVVAAFGEPTLPTGGSGRRAAARRRCRSTSCRWTAAGAGARRARAAE